MKKIIKLFLYIFLITISIYIAYCKFILKTKVIKIFGIAFLIVTTGSMMPTINAGEFLIIKETQNYKVGDIITYSIDEEHLITHRITKISKNQVTTKGDFNSIEDDPINLKQVQGKVIYHFPIIKVNKEAKVEK